MSKAILIKPTGEVTLENPISFKDYQALVGGYIESLPLNDGLSAFINEDGIALELPANLHGTLACLALGYTFLPGDCIKGPLLLVGPADSEGVTQDVPTSLLEVFQLN